MSSNNRSASSCKSKSSAAQHKAIPIRPRDRLSAEPTDRRLFGDTRTVAPNPEKEIRTGEYIDLRREPGDPQRRPWLLPRMIRVTRNWFDPSEFPADARRLPSLPLGEPNLEWAPHQASVDWSLIEFAQRHQHGLIRYGGGLVRPAWLFWQLALAFPNRRLAVVSDRIESLERFRDDLAEIRPQLTIPLLSSRSRLICRDRLICSTPEWLKAAKPERLDFVFFLDPLDAIGYRSQYALTELSRRSHLWAPEIRL